MAMIEVRDDGIGIAPEMLPRIFELFMQAEQRLARTEGGLGVGLTLARRIVEMHGGSIQATSEGVGPRRDFRGAPARARAGAAAWRTQWARRSIATGRPRGGLSVLVVDDNQDAADSVAALLDAAQPPTCGSRTTGRRRSPSPPSARPKSCCSTSGCPGMDGYEVATRLREMSQTRSSTIVALTGLRPGRGPAAHRAGALRRTSGEAGRLRDLI